MKYGKWLLVIGIILLVTIALICVPPLLAYARTELTANSARIMLTAEHQQLSRTYTLNGVTGTADPTQDQVHVRVLAYTTGPQFSLIKARADSASVAHGTLTLRGTSQNETLAADTVFTANNGMKVKTNTEVKVPAGKTVTVAATTVTPGTSGNLGPYGLDTSYTWSYQTYSQMPMNNIFDVFACILTLFIACLLPVASTSYDTAQVYNVTTFSGGKDPAVSQADLDHATAPMATVLTTQGQQEVQQQMRQGEQLVDDIACIPSISPVHVPDNAASVQARVAVKCSALAYQPAQVASLAQQMLSEEAHTQLGAQYLLIGNYTTGIQSAMQTSATFQVSTQGIWVWTLSSTVARQFARLVAGKTQAAALLLLQHQPGVTHVSIQTGGGAGTALPASPQAITFVTA